MLRTIFVAASLVVFLGAAQAADCGLDYGMLVTYLDRAFSEQPVSAGELDNGNQVELFTSRWGSWTLVERLPDGEIRIVASGLRWQRAAHDLAGHVAVKAGEPQS